MPKRTGDTTKLHQANIAKLEEYIADIRRSGRGLPAMPSRPFEISFPLVAKESGVSLWSLVRATSGCRKLIVEDAKDVPLNVRIKPRVRPIYILEETTNIAVAVIQAECESVGVAHQAKCKRAKILIEKIARNRSNGKRDDGITAISEALQQQTYSAKDVTMLVKIKDILIRATRGELELHTFHGRLKLESALVGFSLSAVAKATDNVPQTVINWGAGLKAPTSCFKSEIRKIEEVIGCPEGYLSSVYHSNRSGPTNVKQRFLPEEIRSLPPAQQKRFRRLFEGDLNLAKLSDEELQTLMAEKLAIFRSMNDTIDHKRTKLRLQMTYGLKDLPPHLQQEFDELVKARSLVIVRDAVKSKTRGWDGDTVNIYYRRFCLFFGWMHHSLGVPLENLSIAYLAFGQILHEYDIYLMDRKESVGMERRWAPSTAEWYIFATSLTRRQLGIGNRVEAIPVVNGTPGWLRSRRSHLERLTPIDLPRVADEIACAAGERDDIRQILTSAEISDANHNWAKRLDDTTVEYRTLRQSVRGETTESDSVSRVIPILRFENPLRAIEMGVWSLHEKILELRPGSAHWCTAIREAVAIKFHAQVPFRRKTFCGLTYHPDNTGMVYQERGHWWIKVPAELFKNEKSQAFQKFIVKGFYMAKLQDMLGLYTDLEKYIHEARAGVLSGARSNAFYVTRGNEGHVEPGTFANLFRAFTENHIAENPGRGTGLQGVKPFGSHAMRHIVASAVFNKTGSLAEAALAIHDSEKITEKHYRKYFLDAEKRAKVMRTVLDREPDSPMWPKFGEILPALASPTIAQLIHKETPAVEDVSSI
ncbi:hypothetical protein ACVIHH_002944 [Bradyrhizobium sp. USDA 4518]